MAKVEVRRTDPVYVLELSQKEAEALLNLLGDATAVPYYGIYRVLLGAVEGNW